MAAKKVGVLIKEARSAAGLTQEKLAKAAGEGLTANDIGKCERGEADLTNAQLKKIAVACGVTQSSLLKAPKNLSASAAKAAAAKKTSSAKTTAGKAASGKTSAGKTSSAKTSSGKTSAAQKTSSSAGKAASKTANKPAVPANANTTMKVTASEKKLIEAYRGSTSDLKKVALKVLKGEYGDTINKLLSAGAGSGNAADGLGDMLGDMLSGLLGGK